MICPKCDGKGIIPWDMSQPLSPSVRNAIESGARQSCNECGGTGQVATPAAGEFAQTETPAQDSEVIVVTGTGGSQPDEIPKEAGASASEVGSQDVSA